MVYDHCHSRNIEKLNNMVEPMDDSALGSQPMGLSKEEADSRVSSILRPGSMVMMKITEEDYEKEYWPKLEHAINQLLSMTHADYIPISYEQMYSCVYKCVCKQFSERLYNDLLFHITSHLQQLCQSLKTLDSRDYIDRFNTAMQQFLQALGGIVPIFNYMNRFYVETRLKTDLNSELKKLFVIHVANEHVPLLIPFLVEANSKPFTVSPPVMANLIRSIYTLKPEFAQLRPHLFAKYIPSILPPCTEADLTKYVEEAKQMQRDLLTHPDFISGDRSRKRAGDDDPQIKPTPFSFVPKNASS